MQIEDIRYIPELAESIYSFVHIQWHQHGLHSSFETGLFIVFPKFRSKALLGIDDIHLDAVPDIMNPGYHDPIYNHLHVSDNDCTSNTDIFCWNVKEFQDEVSQ